MQEEDNKKKILLNSLLLFTNNLIKENLIVFSSYYLLLAFNETDGNKKIQIICLLTSAELVLQMISLFFIMPFYIVNIVFKKNLIIFMIASIVFMVPLTFLDGKYKIYLPFASFDILMHKIIEIRCSCYLVYLMPPQWKYAHIRASSLPIYLMTIGKILACIVCFICYDYSDIKLYKYNQIILIGIAFIVYGIIGLVILKSPNFRVKALVRILRKKAVE